MKIAYRYEFPQWLILLSMFVASAIVWPSAPDRVPVHWNLAGEVERYGGKVEGLLVVPLIAAGLYVLLLVLPRIDPGRANYPAFGSAYLVIRVASLVLMAVVHGVIILSMNDVGVDVGRMVAIAMGTVFVAIGLVLGKVRPNWFVGIRTPWTLTSRRSWVRTHRAGGWVFIAIGIATFISGVLNVSVSQPLMLSLIIGGTVLVFAYSYVEWQRDPDRVGPGGSVIHR